MSIAAYNKAWPIKCQPISKLVLVALADRADDNGFCWPSITDIQKRTGLARSSVFEHIAALETAGILGVYREHRKANRYRILGTVQNLDSPQYGLGSPPPAPKVVRNTDPASPPAGPQSSGNRHLNHQGNPPHEINGKAALYPDRAKRCARLSAKPTAELTREEREWLANDRALLGVP